MTQVANQPFPPGALGVVGETFTPDEYDAAKGKQYFREAGLTTGTRIRVGGPVGRYINDLFCESNILEVSKRVMGWKPRRDSRASLREACLE